MEHKIYIILEIIATLITKMKNRIFLKYLEFDSQKEDLYLETLNTIQTFLIIEK